MQEEQQRMQDRFKSSLDAANGEKQALERLRQTLTDQLDELGNENQRLQAANSDLQRQRDQLEDEKEDLLKDKERQIKDKERWFLVFLLHLLFYNYMHKKWSCQSSSFFMDCPDFVATSRKRKKGKSID